MDRIDPIKELSKDHKMVRDLLLNLIDEIGSKRLDDAIATLSELNRLTGPHFRAEEEVEYPLLKKFFGEEYYLKLLEEHDNVIKAARRLAEALAGGSISDDDAKELVELIKKDILPHPVTCEGLGMFIERLSKDELRQLADALVKAREEAVPLLEWAERIRERRL